MPRRRTPHIWTEDHLAKLKRLDELEAEHGAIMRSLRQYRTLKAIYKKRAKLHGWKPESLESTWVHDNARTILCSRPSEAALRERDRRLALPTSMFGDPPPGYSALDRMRREVTA
jgi:hypothetical protein